MTTSSKTTSSKTTSKTASRTVKRQAAPKRKAERTTEAAAEKAAEAEARKAAEAVLAEARKAAEAVLAVLSIPLRFALRGLYMRDVAKRDAGLQVEQADGKWSGTVHVDQSDGSRSSVKLQRGAAVVVRLSPELQAAGVTADNWRYVAEAFLATTGEVR